MATLNRPSGRLTVHGKKRNWSSEGLCDVGYQKKKRKKFDFLLVHQLFKRIQIAVISINFIILMFLFVFFVFLGALAVQNSLCGAKERSLRSREPVIVFQLWELPTPSVFRLHPFFLFFGVYPVIHMVSVHKAVQRCLWEISHTADHYTKYSSHKCTHAHTHKNHYSLVRGTFWFNWILGIVQLKIQSSWKGVSQLKGPILYLFSSLCFSS